MKLLLYFIISAATQFPLSESLYCHLIEGDLDLSKPPCNCFLDKDGGWLVYNNTYIRHFNSTSIEVSSLYTSEYGVKDIKEQCSLRNDVDDRLYCPFSSLLRGKTNVTVIFRDKNTGGIKRSKFDLHSDWLKYCDCDIGVIPSWKQLTWKNGKVSWKALQKLSTLLLNTKVWLEQEGEKYYGCRVSESESECSVSVVSLAAHNKPFKVCLQPESTFCDDESIKPVCSDELRLQLHLLFERFAIKDDLECQRTSENGLDLSWSIENEHEVFETVELLVYHVGVRDNNGRLIYNSTTHDYEMTNFPPGISERAYSFQVETCLTTGECSGKKRGNCPSNKDENGLGAYLIPIIIVIIVVTAIILCNTG